MGFLEKKINQFKLYIYNYMDLAEDAPGVRDKINGDFIDKIFHENMHNIVAGSGAVVLFYTMLLFFNHDWKLHLWGVVNLIFYFMRYSLFRIYKTGSFLGFKRKEVRLSDIEIMFTGAFLGLSFAYLGYLVSNPPYEINAQYGMFFGYSLFFTGCLIINSNAPIWTIPLTVCSIVPLSLILILKGGVFIAAGVVLSYYSIFVFIVSMRSYGNSYNNYFLNTQNMRYLEDMGDSKIKLEALVNDLERKNAQLIVEVSLRKETENKLQKLASMDVLTGVTNRVSLDEKIKRAIQNAKRTETLVGIFFIDLDRFKFINDTFGHAIGDELLKAVAKRLEQSLRSSDEISRIGGDEFVLVFTNVFNLEGFLNIAQNLLILLEKPYQINKKLITSYVSMGISVFPQNGDNSEGLLRDADTAMYRAKEIGGNSFLFYSEDMNHAMMRRLKIEGLIQYALANDGFNFFIQPIFCLKTGKIVSAEALIRFKDSISDEFGYIGPDEFIPVAEDAGLITKIGVWGIIEACRIISKWQLLGVKPIHITLNISVKHLVDPHFLEDLTTSLTSSGVDPCLLCLEITETQAIQNREFVQDVLEKIVALGISLSIDDFGTGHSNFCYLRELPVSKIKIDRSFLMGWEVNKNSKALVKAIISVSKALSLEVVAEGVETFEQLEFLKKNKCDFAQGYYFSRPVSEEVFFQLVEKRCFGEDYSQAVLLEKIETSVSSVGIVDEGGARRPLH